MKKNNKNISFTKLKEHLKSTKNHLDEYDISQKSFD